MTKERKISPSIHCKNIPSNCHCSFINSPFPLHLPMQQIVLSSLHRPTSSHTVIQSHSTYANGKKKKWSIQTQVATDVSFTNYHHFTRQQEKMTSLETLVEVLHSPLCWFTSINLTVWFWWRRGDKRDSFHPIHHFKDARPSSVLYDKVHRAL